MNIEIDEKYDAFIQQRMAADQLNSAKLVIEDALNRLMIDDTDFAPGEIDDLIKPALEQLDRGEGIPLDDAMRMVRETIRAESKRAVL